MPAWTSGESSKENLVPGEHHREAKSTGATWSLGKGGSSLRRAKRPPGGSAVRTLEIWSSLPAYLNKASHQGLGCLPIFSGVSQWRQTTHYPTTGQSAVVGSSQLLGALSSPASLFPPWRSPSLAPGCEALQQELGWVHGVPTSCGC